MSPHAKVPPGGEGRGSLIFVWFRLNAETQMSLAGQWDAVNGKVHTVDSFAPPVKFLFKKLSANSDVLFC